MNKIESENLIQLVIDAQNGDEKAFEELYRQTIKFAYGTAKLLLSNENDIEEALQNSYMYVAKSLCDLKKPEKFKYWLSVIVKHECQKYITKQKKMSDVFIFISKSKEFELPTENNILPIELIEKNEVRSAVQELVGKLSDDKRACVVLYYFEQHSLPEIAEILDIPEGTVKSRLYSARKFLEKEFKKLQKKDDTLFGVSIIPLVTVLFAYQMKNIVVPFSISKGAALVAASTASAATATTAAVGVTAATSGVTTVSAATTVTAATGASAAAGTAVATKVAAVAVAASVAVGGGIATVNYVSNKNESAITQSSEITKNEEHVSISSAMIEEIALDLTETESSTTNIPTVLFTNRAETEFISAATSVSDSQTEKQTTAERSTTAKSTTQKPTTTKQITTTKPTITLAETTEVTTEQPTTTAAPTTDATDVYSVSNGIMSEYTGSDSNVAIPSSVGGDEITSIGTGAFAGNTDIISVSVPSTVTRIGQEAFADCPNLISASLPSSLQSVGIGAFCGCTGLTSVNIPSGAAAIGDDAFADCSSLRAITIPASVTSIGDNAFGGCDNLTIKCSEGSAAHNYAVENSVNYELI